MLGEEGTDLRIREHGSGAYENREDLRFLTENKSIKLDRNVSANYYPTEIILPRNGSRSISSLWSAECRARNGITRTSFRESYRYSNRLDAESHFDLDENGSMIDIKSDLQGLVYMGILKEPNRFAAKGEGTFTAEEYAGSFLIKENIHDFGQDLMLDRSVSGSGYIASNTQVGNRQRSHESGTGAYRSEERIDTLGGFMAKDLEASHYILSYKISSSTSLNLSQKWAEGMWSKSKSSFIDEEISSARRLKKKAVAASLKDLESETSFSGKAEFRTSSGKSKSRQVDQDVLLIGDYKVKRRITRSVVSEYNKPHIYIRKEGKLHNDVATYTIVITNDGNSSFGPLLLWDLFPPGARFINSSLQPSQLNQDSSNWTLLSFAVGDTVKIKINLDVKECDGNIINRVGVAGNSSFGPAATWNQSIINRSWLGGCAPDSEDIVPICSSCALSQEEIANESEYFDPVLAQWDAENDSSCPLSCPEASLSYELVNLEGQQESS